MIRKQLICRKFKNSIPDVKALTRARAPRTRHLVRRVVAVVKAGDTAKASPAEDPKRRQRLEHRRRVMRQALPLLPGTIVDGRKLALSAAGHFQTETSPCSP